jgi:hypothetical protein
LPLEKPIIFLYGIPHILRSTMKFSNQSSNATLFRIDFNWSKIQRPHYKLLKESRNYFSENVSLLLIRNKPDQHTSRKFQEKCSGSIQTPNSVLFPLFIQCAPYLALFLFSSVRPFDISDLLI